MAEAAKKTDGYGWVDYRSWDDGKRWEIIGGEAFAMSPAPTTRHQGILIELSAQMLDHFRDKRCVVFAAPTDVKLSEEDVVQPDLLVVCDKRKVKPTHIEGAPALIVEILSPSSALADRTLKMRLYAKAGVKEVWLVTPYPSLVEVFQLDGKAFKVAGAFGKDDTFGSPTFRDLRLDLKRLFDFPLEPGEEIRVVRETPPPYGKKRK